MGEREVNPLDVRRVLLSARFNSAWAFHQLLVGMQRLATTTGFQSKSPIFRLEPSEVGPFRSHARGGVEAGPLEHFSHFIEQAILDRHAEQAGSLLPLQQRLMRDLAGLMKLMSGFSLAAPGRGLPPSSVEQRAPARSELAAEASEPGGELDGERDVAKRLSDVSLERLE